jgi:hypothetical protein
MAMGGQRHAPAALPQKRAPVPILQEPEWAPVPAWTGVGKRNSLPPPEFEHRNVQPVAICYTDNAVRPLFKVEW